MKSALKKIFFLFLLPVTSYLLLATILPSPVRAQCGPVDPKMLYDQVINKFNECAIITATYDDKVFNLNATVGLVSSLDALITGNAPATPALAQIFQNHNALASTGNMIALMYAHPPVSGVEYFAKQFNKINPVKSAYAQAGTIGFTALQPVEALWTQFRNLSYVGFVLVFIVIGFMIMFRAKVSAQTVATLQDSIPRIVIALILVTFSYAIVGLMIDLMFVTLNLAINALGPVINPQQANSVIFGKSIIGAITTSWPDLVGSTSKAVNDVIKNVNIGGKILDVLTFGAIGGIAGLIVGVAALFIMFKILFMLLMAYVSIIIYTVFAPFMLLFQALPGNNGAVGWIKQIVANLAVFVAVALMLLFAGIFGNIEALGGSGTKIGTGNIGQFPLILGGIDVVTVGRLIGFGFLFMIPAVAGMIKEKLKAGSVGFGGPGAAALGAAAGYAGRAASNNPYSTAGKELLSQQGQTQTAAMMGRLSPVFGGKKRYKPSGMRPYVEDDGTTTGGTTGGTTT